MKHTSDGSTASYYELPDGATELQHLISYRNMNAQDGEIFRAIYRKGRASHSDELRDAKKVLFYAQAEVERLEKLQKKPIKRELYDDDTEARMDVVGLVEALEPIEKGEDTGPDGWGAFRWADCRNIARAALAAHRKGGEV